MDPLAQECMSLFLYGAGYFAQDENTLSLLNGGEAPAHFCLQCPKNEECENEHEKLVRDKLPAEAEMFDRLLSGAVQRGMPATLAAVRIGQQGQDPFASVAVDNFKRGHAERGRISGRLAG
jgi:hypothetical protein